jgi:hypothetical protein
MYLDGRTNLVWEVHMNDPRSARHTDCSRGNHHFADPAFACDGLRSALGPFGCPTRDPFPSPIMWEFLDLRASEGKSGRAGGRRP